MSRHEGPRPVPFADGSVPQTIVHYLGPGEGAMAWTGRASGQRYPFSASECCRYIPDEDLELFRLLPREFYVFDNDDSHIDPAVEKARAERDQLKEELKHELLISLPATLARPTRHLTKRSPGRRSGTGFGAFLECLMTCGHLGELYGSVEAAYDAIAERLMNMPEWSRRVPPRAHFANACSYARSKRRDHGGCTWHGHPEPWPV